MSPLRIRGVEDRGSAIAALAALPGSRRGLDALMADLDRRAHRSRAPGRAVKRALSWNLTDRWDWRWYPQGITSSADAGADTGTGTGEETVGGRRILVTSWYARNPESGSRLTFLDLDRLRYRHVRLVVPTVRDAAVTLAPLRVHAGGIVWHRDWIHVAATGSGFFTAHVADLMSTPQSLRHRIDADWILPVRQTYVADSDGPEEPLRYSFMSLDRSGPHLLVGEYGRRQQTTRLARFPLEPDSGLPALDETGVSRPVEVIDPQISSAQGAVLVHGRRYLTASHGRFRRGSVYVDSSETTRRHRSAVPPGPEDLTWWPSTDELWTQAEHPGLRWVLSIDRSWFDGDRV
ncbi:MAG: hypothetical protein ACSLEW_04605 [Nocardioides sp.]